MISEIQTPEVHERVSFTVRLTQSPDVIAQTSSAVIASQSGEPLPLSDLDRQIKAALEGHSVMVTNNLFESGLFEFVDLGNGEPFVKPTEKALAKAALARSGEIFPPPPVTNI